MPLELRTSTPHPTLTRHPGPAPASTLPTLLLSPTMANLWFPRHNDPSEGQNRTVCAHPPRRNPSRAPPSQCQGPAGLRAARGRHVQGKGVWEEVHMKAEHAGPVYFSNGHQRCCASDFGDKAEPNREEKAHHPLGTHRTALLALAQSLVLLPALCLHIGLDLTQPHAIGIMPILQMGMLRLRKTK